MWSPTLNNPARLSGVALLCAAALGAGACSLTSRKPPPQPAHPVVTAQPPLASAPAGAVPPGLPPVRAPRRPPRPPLRWCTRTCRPRRARTLTRAVNLMRAGNTAEAELAFQQIATQYPQFAAPLVNLGLMQRKQGQLDKAEESLKSAVAARGRKRRGVDRTRCNPENAGRVQGRRGLLPEGRRSRSAIRAGVAQPGVLRGSLPGRPGARTAGVRAVQEHSPATTSR